MRCQGRAAMLATARSVRAGDGRGVRVRVRVRLRLRVRLRVRVRVRVFRARASGCRPGSRKAPSAEMRSVCADTRPQPESGSTSKRRSPWVRVAGRIT